MTTSTATIRGVRLVQWVAACAVAEAVGMTAAAAASRAGAPGWVVLGGLVEGLALGVAQAGVLAAGWPRLRTRRFVVVTTLVAGVGWTVGSVPGAMSQDTGGADPPLGLVLLAAAGLGVVMGSLLGGAQAVVLRGVVERTGRWVTANATAWPLAMAVIFVGATRPGEAWSFASVLLAAATTGAAAGAVLGFASWPWIRTMTPVLSDETPRPT